MMPATGPVSRPLRFLALAAAPGVLCVGAPALADTQAGADVSVSGRVASNPFLQQEAFSSASGSLQVSPWLRFFDERTNVDARGSFGGNLYTRGQGSDTTVAARVNARHQISPFTGIGGGVGYRWSNASAHNFLLDRDGAADDVPLPTEPLPDVTIAGLRIRTETLNANLNVDVQPSQRDQFSVNFGASRSKFGTQIASDFDTYSAGASYARTLSARTSLTASVQVARSDFLDTQVGDGTIITPQAGVEQQLGQRWSLSASAGASFARTRLGDGANRTFTTFSGNLRLCNTGERTVLCINGARMAQATAIGGIVTVTSANASYDYQIGERDRLTLTGRYSKNDNAVRLLGNSTEFYGASARFSRSFDRRISAFISPSFSKLTGSTRSVDANYQLEAGLRFRLGAIS